MPAGLRSQARSPRRGSSVGACAAGSGIAARDDTPAPPAASKRADRSAPGLALRRPDRTVPAPADLCPCAAPGDTRGMGSRTASSLLLPLILVACGEPTGGSSEGDSTGDTTGGTGSTGEPT